MEPIEGSETSASKPQTPGKYPKENILQNDLIAVVSCSTAVVVRQPAYHCEAQVQSQASPVWICTGKVLL